MNILFICASNKDRSPALQRHFEKLYPEHSFRSAGINKYFTTKNGTHLVDDNDISWAHGIVFASKRLMDIYAPKHGRISTYVRGEFTHDNPNPYLDNAEERVELLLRIL